MLHGNLYDSITDTYYTWFAVLLLLVQEHRLMWPLACSIGSVAANIKAFQLGVLQFQHGLLDLLLLLCMPTPSPSEVSLNLFKWWKQHSLLGPQGLP